jgi:hypothetical protein
LELSGYEAMWAWHGEMKQKVGVVGPNMANLHLLWLTKCVELRYAPPTKYVLYCKRHLTFVFVFFSRSWPAIVVIGTICLLLIILLCVHYVNKAF